MVAAVLAARALLTAGSNIGPMSMSQKVSRRDFVRAGTGIVAAGAAPAFGQGPTVRTAPTRPVVIASANGNRFKNGGPRTAVEEALPAHDRAARTSSTP